MLTGNKKGFGTFASKGANIMLSELACSLDGTAPENTGIDPMNPVYDTHKLPAFAPEDGMYEGYFKFRYDWRLSCEHNAEILEAFINKVCSEKGYSKVNLVGRCLGGNVVSAYLENAENLDKINLDDNNITYHLEQDNELVYFQKHFPLCV